MRGIWMAAGTLVAAMALAGCSGGADEVNTGMIGSASATPTTTAPAPVTGGGSGTGTTGGGKQQAARCTDRIDYAGDTRSNAEINSIGERTGTCPPVQRPSTTAPGKPGDPSVKCTDRINYAGDPRSNAEINSIGADTGTCPAPQH